MPLNLGYLTRTCTDLTVLTAANAKKPYRPQPRNASLSTVQRDCESQRHQHLFQTKRSILLIQQKDDRHKFLGPQNAKTAKETNNLSLLASDFN